MHCGLLANTLKALLVPFINLEMDEAKRVIRHALGEIPIVSSEQAAKDLLATPVEEEFDELSPKAKVSKSRILADGSYATETAFSEPLTQVRDLKAKPPIRSLLIEGDYFLGSVLGSTLTKMALRYEKICKDQELVNNFKTDAMLIITSIIRLGKSVFSAGPIDEDSYSRLMTCVRVLSKGHLSQAVSDAFLIEPRKAFQKSVLAKQVLEKNSSDSVDNKSRLEDVISFRLIQNRNAGAVDAVISLNLA